MAHDQLIRNFVIRARQRAGYDDDGNAVFTWSDAVAGIALKWEERDEFDADSGSTYVAGTLLIANPANTPVNEAAIAVDQDTGQVWRITSVEDLPDATRLAVERVDG